MAQGFLLISFCVAFLSIFLFIWIKKDRRYESSKSVASAYDDWTSDKLLEKLWGDHVHLGFYGLPPKKIDFRYAKIVFVHQLVKWSGLDKLPPGSRVLDVGCGIGGSSRILARDYGFDVLGISISTAQIKRAKELTNEEISCEFLVMDALDLEFSEASFDAVWSVEVGPHILDKQRYADELLRVLRPGGVLAVADWNRRDPMQGELNILEKLIMNQLLNQWAHPEFASIPQFRNHLKQSIFSNTSIDTDDWTHQTLPSWLESVLEGIRRPEVLFALGPKAFLKALREIPTILLMWFAFSKGMMRFGVFRSSPK